jgi:hypothetical protein
MEVGSVVDGCTLQCPRVGPAGSLVDAAQLDILLPQLFCDTESLPWTIPSRSSTVVGIRPINWSVWRTSAFDDDERHDKIAAEEEDVGRIFIV